MPTRPFRFPCSQPAGAALVCAAAAGACAAAALPASASAQGGAESPAAAPTVGAGRTEPGREPGEERVPRVVLAGGVDADQHSRGGYPPQLALHAGYQLRGGERVGGPRLGVRVGLDFTASNVDESDALGLPFSSRRSRAFGVALLGTYALTRGPVRPYLVGGVGAYEIRAATTYRYSVVLASGQRETDRTERVGAGSLGVSVGAGLSAPVGPVVLFGEARATVLPSTVLSDTPGFRGMQLPLVLGVRF